MCPLLLLLLMPPLHHDDIVRQGAHLQLLWPVPGTVKSYLKLVGILLDLYYLGVCLSEG